MAAIIRRRSSSERTTLLFVFFIFVAGTSSAVWSWQRLKPLLLQQGAFEWSCTEGSVPVVNAGAITAKCVAQEAALTKAWRWGCASPMIFSFFLGYMFDQMGSRWTGVCGQLLFMFGLFSFALAGVMPSSTLYYIGFTFIGIAQVPVFTSCVSLCNLFPRSPNFVIGFLSAAGDLSYNVPVILDNLRGMFAGTNTLPNSVHHSTEKAFFWYGLLFCGSQTCVALALLPRRQFEMVVDETAPLLSAGRLREVASTGGSIMSVTSTAKAAPLHDTAVGNTPLLISVQSSRNRRSGLSLNSCDLDSSSSHTDLHNAPLRQQIWSVLFLPQLVYFAVGFLRQCYTNGAIDAILGAMSDTKTTHQANALLEVFKVLQQAGFLFALAFGAFADFASLSVALVVHNTMALIAALSVTLIGNLWFQPIGFVAFQFFTSFLFTQSYCWVNKAFGFTNVNLLMALLQGPAGIIQVVLDWVLPLCKLDQVALNTAVNTFFLVVTPFLYAVPVILWRYNRWAVMYNAH